jgi:hypothetical protein
MKLTGEIEVPVETPVAVPLTNLTWTGLGLNTSLCAEERVLIFFILSTFPCFYVLTVLAFAFCAYCTTHTTQTSMSPTGFEPETPASDRPQTFALGRSATGIGSLSELWHIQPNEAACFVSPAWRGQDIFAFVKVLWTKMTDRRSVFSGNTYPIFGPKSDDLTAVSAWCYTST